MAPRLVTYTVRLEPGWNERDVHLFRRGANDNRPPMRRLLEALADWHAAALDLLLAASLAFGPAGIACGLLAALGWS